jgi:hypothetical protein
MARRPPRRYSSWPAYYAFRVRHGVERGLTPAQARGHPRAGERRASEVEREVTVIGPNGAQVVRVTGVRDLSRAGAFDRDVRELLAGRIPARSFDRRWGGRTVGGVAVPNADRVLALGHAGRVGFDDFYPSRGAA